MDSKVYNKNDILNKLAQDGFFVDLLTLDSFLAKYKIEAIFEDENGCEFFDKMSYDMLVKNVLNKENTPSEEDSSSSHVALDVKQDERVNIAEESNVEPVQDKIEITDESLNSGEHATCGIDTTDEQNSDSLNEIKWHKWDDVSKELKQSSVDNDEFDSIHDDAREKSVEDSCLMGDVVEHQEVQVEELNKNLVDDKNINDSSAINSTVSNESKKELQQIMSSDDSNEEDFDDIGLLSDSIQAQEKFQKYIVSELAKRNVDVTPPKNENAFKFDISEKTLNMIARAIAKKITKQVSLAISTDRKNDERLMQAEKNSLALEQKVNSLEEQNRKLKLLLAESNKNLNSYQPTFFGLYKFVRNKSGKRK